MKKIKTRVVNVRDELNTTIQIDIDERLVEFYKKETGRKRVTAKGLSKFFNNLIHFFNRFVC